MSTTPFQSALASRLAKSGAASSDAQLDDFELYYQLLDKWNRRMNLTALPLGPSPPDETLDRLFVEPLIASDFIDETPLTVVDLGSGAGSPAIPLKIARPSLRMTLVEARSRKTSFLRELVRVLELNQVTVHTGRFQDFSSSVRGAADLVTARALRADQEFLDSVDMMLKLSGRLMIFGSGYPAPRFAISQRKNLPAGSVVTLYERSDV